jgi:hypothetical protein
MAAIEPGFNPSPPVIVACSHEAPPFVVLMNRFKEPKVTMSALSTQTTFVSTGQIDIGAVSGGGSQTTWAVHCAWVVELNTSQTNAMVTIVRVFIKPPMN